MAFTASGASHVNSIHTVKSIRSLFVALGVALLALMPSLGAEETGSKSVSPPNILLILADDLGYEDLGCYGGKSIRTPNIDKLAANGARFTDFYVTAPRCTPTRGSLLTGRYPARNGLTGLIWPEDTYGLAPEEITIAELLREKGYKTALVGKWHLGHQPQFLPTRQGFEEWFGMPYPNDMDGRHPRSKSMKLNWPPLPLYRNEQIIEQPVGLDDLTRRYTEECEKFIETNKGRPWFLFYSSHAPHTWLAASEAFRGKSANGLFGDMVEEFDWSVGRIVDALRRTGQNGNTLILFTNDNGAAIPKPGEREKREQDPVYAEVPGDRSIGSNAPLRGGKNTPYEGGVRVPAIVVLPGAIRPGQTITAPSIINDFFPTIATFAGLSLPTDRVIDGKDLAALLRGTGTRPPETLFFNCPRVQSSRMDRWTLVFPSSPWAAVQAPPELYDIQADPGQTKNVAAENPAIVQQMSDAIAAFNKELAPAEKPVP